MHGLRYIDPKNPKLNRYSKTFKNNFLKIFEEKMDVQAACKEMGIERGTFYHWMKGDRKYADRFFKLQHNIYDVVKGSVLDAYMECGSICRAMKMCNVAQSSFYNWITADPEYKRVYYLAKELVHDRLKDKAVTLALDGDKDMLKYLLKNIFRSEELQIAYGQKRKEDIEDAEFSTISEFEDIIGRLASSVEMEDREDVGENRPVLSASVSPESERLRG